MPLQTTNSIKVSGSVAGYIAPTIYVAFTVDRNGNAVIDLGIRNGLETLSSTGFESVEQIRATNAQLVAQNASFTSAINTLRGLFEGYAKSVLDTANPGATITIV